MSELARLQEQFQAYLLHADTQIEDMIIGTDDAPVALRLMIYGNAYKARLLEALESTYSILKTYLGDDDFNQLGNEYIDTYPSTYRSIRWFGDRFPEFLISHSHYGDYPFISELAKIEWTMALVFDAADDAILIPNDLHTLPHHDWPHLQIHFHSSLQLINVSWNVFEIWQSISDELDPPEPVCSSSPVTWVLWRKDLLNHYSSLTTDEAQAMNIVIQHGTFGMICEGLCHWHDDQSAVTRAASLLKGWINAGMVKKTYNLLEG